jgi:hypothetical protein
MLFRLRMKFFRQLPAYGEIGRLARPLRRSFFLGEAFRYAAPVLECDGACETKREQQPSTVNGKSQKVLGSSA